MIGRRCHSPTQRSILCHLDPRHSIRLNSILMTLSYLCNSIFEGFLRQRPRSIDNQTVIIRSPATADGLSVFTKFLSFLFTNWQNRSLHDRDDDWEIVLRHYQSHHRLTFGFHPLWHDRRCRHHRFDYRLWQPLHQHIECHVWENAGIRSRVRTVKFSWTYLFSLDES